MKMNFPKNDPKWIHTLREGPQRYHLLKSLTLGYYDLEVAGVKIELAASTCIHVKDNEPAEYISNATIYFNMSFASNGHDISDILYGHYSSINDAASQIDETCLPFLRDLNRALSEALKDES